jgi:hypothetical protein
MYKTVASAGALSMAAACFSTASAPAAADVVVNNILSPFVTIQVIPGHRARPARWSLHDPRYRARCNYRWHPYWGEWRVYCHRSQMYRGKHY